MLQNLAGFSDSIPDADQPTQFISLLVYNTPANKTFYCLILLKQTFLDFLEQNLLQTG